MVDSYFLSALKVFTIILDSLGAEESVIVIFLSAPFKILYFIFGDLWFHYNVSRYDLFFIFPIWGHLGLLNTWTCVT